MKINSISDSTVSVHLHAMTVKWRVNSTVRWRHPVVKDSCMNAEGCEQSSLLNEDQVLTILSLKADLATLTRI